MQSSDLPVFSIRGRRPMLLKHGDRVLIEHYVIEDAGDAISVSSAFVRPGMIQRCWVNPNAIKMILDEDVT